MAFSFWGAVKTCAKSPRHAVDQGEAGQHRALNQVVGARARGARVQIPHGDLQEEDAEEGDEAFLSHCVVPGFLPLILNNCTKLRGHDPFF